MIARILAFSVHQRWLVVLLSLVAAAFGVYSLNRLPIDAVPDITNNQVQINTTAPSLSPHDVEKQVTYPIETAIAGIPGLEYTRSLSRNGFSQVTAVFSDKLDIYFARQQVNQRLSEARSSLPPEAEPRMGPISTGLGEIYMWTVHYKEPGKGAPVQDGQPGWQSDGSYLTPEGQLLKTELERAAYLRTVQDWIIRPQLRTVPGVAGVDAIGGFEKQYHVQPDPAKLIGLELSFSDIAVALGSNNANRGAGYLEQNGEGYVVRSAGRLESMEDIGNVVVATRGGVPVRVKDVAQVNIGRELRTGSASENGRESVLGTALMLIGGNSRTVSAAVDAKMAEFNRTLPPNIEAKTVLNRTLLVDATVKTVAKNLVEGALLVILVLFLLLGNFRAALITALVIPIAMLMTMTGMMQGKISANLMSLGALDFGLIVDGAVLIARNSLRHLAARQHALSRRLTKGERLSDRHRGLPAPPDLHRCRGQDVRTDGADRHHRVDCRLCPLADLRPGVDRDCHDRAGAGAGEHLCSEPEEDLRPGTTPSDPLAARLHHRRSRPARCGGFPLHPPGPGVHPKPRREEHRHECVADSERGAEPVAGHAARH
jgi:heavy metal efflux system protein